MLDRQFLLEEETMQTNNVHVVETSQKGSSNLQTFHTLSVIQDQCSYDVRAALDEIVKGIRCKRPHLNKLVVDFCRDGLHYDNRIVFLQIKFASEDRVFERVEDMRPKPPKVIKDVSDQVIKQQKMELENKKNEFQSDGTEVLHKKRTDFFLNRKSLISSYEQII